MRLLRIQELFLIELIQERHFMNLLIRLKLMKSNLREINFFLCLLEDYLQCLIHKLRNFYAKIDLI